RRREGARGEPVVELRRGGEVVALLGPAALLGRGARLRGEDEAGAEEQRERRGGDLRARVHARKSSRAKSASTGTPAASIASRPPSRRSTSATQATGTS